MSDALAEPWVAADLVRFEVTFSRDAAAEFQQLCTGKGVSWTEGMRRAIATWKFLEEQRARGHSFAVIQRDRSGEQLRELVLWD